MRDRKGFTPLQHALRGPRNRECAVILLESGAQFDVDIFETDYGTLLHEARPTNTQLTFHKH